MLADTHEVNAKTQGHAWVCGVDEVGRGPLAGPVVAAAVVVPPDAKLRRFLLSEAGDSKALTPKKRAGLAPFIHQHCKVSIAEASVTEIDTLNIRQATHVAMGRAVAGLSKAVGAEAPLYCLVDGNDLPAALRGHTIIKGDAVELAIACASIVAKVYRDALMIGLDKEFQGYGWASNAGYGSPGHLAALLALGATVHHRASFAPVKAVLERQNVSQQAA